jgi:hypothetical protein
LIACGGGPSGPKHPAAALHSTTRPAQEEAMSLTGRFNFRTTWFGGLALEIEEEVKPLFGSGDKLKRRWRRATLIDLAQPEMRALIDLRFQPQYLARSPVRAAVATSPMPASNGIGAELPPSSPAADQEQSPQRTTH